MKESKSTEFSSDSATMDTLDNYVTPRAGHSSWGLTSARSPEVDSSLMVSSIVAKFDDICMEVTSNINQIQDVKVRAEKYLEFLDKDSVKTMISTMASYAEKTMNQFEVDGPHHELSQQGQSLVLKPRGGKHSSSTYEVVLKAKPECKIDPIQVYKSIVTTHDIVANDWMPFNIADLRIEMMSQADAVKLMDILGQGIYEEVKISDMFEISAVTKSNYAVKSVAIDEQEMAKLPWIGLDYKIDFGKALNTMTVPTNKHWFTAGDIENLEVYKLGASAKFVVKISVSKECFHRFLAHGCSNRKVDIGLSRPVTFQEEVRHDACWNCMEFGHSTTRCRGKNRCRFCGAGHKSSECKQRQAPACFRCSSAQNIVSHDALSNACPFVKQRRDEVRNALRAKFGGKHDQQ